MVYVTSASRYVTSASHYHPRYQSRSSMYIRGLIPRNFAELAEAVPIASVLNESDWTALYLVSYQGFFFQKKKDACKMIEAIIY